MLPYFKYLTFDKLDIIQEKTLDILNRLYGGNLHEPGAKCLCHVDDLTAEIMKVPELLEELDKRGWRDHVLLLRLFSLEPIGEAITWEGGGWPIHTDGSSEQKIQNDYRLVIPIFNTEGTKTRFYECTDPGKAVIEYEGGPQYKLYDWDKCTEFTSYELTSPVLINTNYPHSVDGPSNEWHRISLGITFKPDIELIATEF